MNRLRDMPRGVGRLEQARIQRQLLTFAEFPANRISIWLKASEGPFQFGTGISQWKDRSAFGYAPANANTAQQPLLNRNYYRGLPAVVFDGSDQLNTGAIYNSPAEWTAAALYVPQSGGSLLNADVVGFNRHSQTINLGGDGTLSSIAFNTGGSPFFNTTTNTTAMGAIAVGAVVRSTTAFQAVLNGLPTVSPSATTGTPASGTTVLTVGAHNIGEGQFFQGGLLEAVICNYAASTREREVIEGVLVWNNNLGDWNPLPASHPFKNSPPLIGD